MIRTVFNHTPAPFPIQDLFDGDKSRRLQSNKRFIRPFSSTQVFIPSAEFAGLNDWHKRITIKDHPDGVLFKLG